MEIFETDAVTVTIVHIFLLIVLISWNVEAFQQPFSSPTFQKFTITHGLVTTNTSKKKSTEGIFSCRYSVTKPSSSREVFQHFLHHTRY